MASYSAHIKDTSGYSDIVPMFPPSTWRILVQREQTVLISAVTKSRAALASTSGYTDSLTTRIVTPTIYHAMIFEFYHETDHLGQRLHLAIAHGESYTDHLVATKNPARTFNVLISDVEGSRD